MGREKKEKSPRRVLREWAFMMTFYLPEGGHFREAVQKSVSWIMSVAFSAPSSFFSPPLSALASFSPMV